MDKNEIVARLDTYIGALEQNAQIDDEIRNLESKIRTSVDSSYNYTFIRFFWPFLVLYPVFGTMIYMAFAFLFKAETQGDLYICMLVGFGIYFIGSVFIAKALRNRKCNKEYQQKLALKLQTDEIMRKRIEELENANQANLAVMKEHQDLLPASCRNLDSAKKIRMMLFRGKFETVEEAVEFMS